MVSAGICHAVFICLVIRSVSGLRIGGPGLVLQGSPLWLNCSDDLGVAPSAVWWYKDNMKFYSYDRQADPPSRSYRVPGVHVDHAQSSEGFVRLLDADIRTRGVYRCDLALEPGVVPQHAQLQVRVVAADLQGPTLTGIKARYRIGERINATCSSGLSSAGPTLHWLINDREPNEQETEQRVELVRVGNLEERRQQLALRARDQHFVNGVMRISCIMDVPELGRRVAEKLVTRATTPHLRPENQEEGVVLSVPNKVILDSGFWLNCSSPGAHSIHWLKDGQEFYEYSSTESSSPKIDNTVPGIHVNEDVSYRGHVYLSRSELATEGTYTCKVKLPSYRTKVSEKKLQVYALPSKDPEIENLRTAYKIGDAINVTCSNGPSKPAPILTWYVNGGRVDENVTDRAEIPTGKGTFYAVARLELPAEPTLTNNKSLMLKCQAYIGDEYSGSAERLIDILPPQAWAGPFGSGSTQLGPFWIIAAFTSAFAVFCCGH
ncbi:uncharacterized protein LOC119379258 [Rhipicephalus sanguineus]|uniref:uncharacterized protein LOC119379258 n=1 Tax=Rhipicephalus sanguineus TaxID=34632 RepID=UPI0018950236|nr:uncharacterized protein LOC119379258 [Rhipicephalus sanguineus]